jgi:hypothetical protein
VGQEITKSGCFSCVDRIAPACARLKRYLFDETYPPENVPDTLEEAAAKRTFKAGDTIEFD